MPTISIAIDSPLKLAGLIVSGGIVMTGAVLVCMWAAGNVISTRLDSKDLAELATSLAPGDPQTHYASARFHEATFELGDAEIARRELETAAALLPNSYSLWLAVARTREAFGDRDGAEKALRRAKELAPNYSRVCWALGNILLRNGNTDAAFVEMQKAAAGDVKYAQPLVYAARLFYNDDTRLVRRAVGDASPVLAALSLAYALEKRYDDAMSVWLTLSPDQARENPDTGKQLLVKLLEGKRFTDAVNIANLLGDGPYAIGEIYNGGFENGIATGGAPTFDWQIADGAQPQIALTNGQKHSGEFSLLTIFRATPGKEFRPIAQTVAVERGTAYRFTAFYRSDIKTTAKIRWQIIAATDSRPIAATDPMIIVSDWTKLETAFSVPPDIDGIIVRLVREDCALPACAVAGNLWIDDVSLARR